MNADRLKLSEETREILQSARTEAIQRNHAHLGTEHIFLAIIAYPNGLAAKLLIDYCGIDLQKAKNAIDFIISDGEKTVSHEQIIELTPRGKKVFELAIDEARRQRKDEVSAIHLLIGLLREESNVAAGVLESFGLSLERIRVATYT